MIKIYRNRAEITLIVDNQPPIKASAPDDDFSVFNSQSYITIGGKIELTNPQDLSSFKKQNSESFGPIQTRPFYKTLYPFQGTITGLVFNKRRILDNIKDGSGYVQGDVVLQASGNVLAGVGLDRTSPKTQKPFVLPSYNKTVTYTITESIKTTDSPTVRNTFYEENSLDLTTVPSDNKNLEISSLETNLTTMKTTNQIPQDYDYGACDYPSCSGKIQKFCCCKLWKLHSVIVYFINIFLILGDGDLTSTFDYSDDPPVLNNTTDSGSTQITTTLGVIAGVGLGAVVLLIILYLIFKFGSTKYIEQDEKDLPKGVQPGKIKSERKSNLNNNSNLGSKNISPRVSVGNIETKINQGSLQGEPINTQKLVFQPASPPKNRVEFTPGTLQRNSNGPRTGQLSRHNSQSRNSTPQKPPQINFQNQNNSMQFGMNNSQFGTQPHQFGNSSSQISQFGTLQRMPISNSNSGSIVARQNYNYQTIQQSGSCRSTQIGVNNIVNSVVNSVNSPNTPIGKLQSNSSSASRLAKGKDKSDREYYV